MKDKALRQALEFLEKLGENHWGKTIGGTGQMSLQQSKKHWQKPILRK